MERAELRHANRVLQGVSDGIAASFGQPQPEEYFLATHDDAEQARAAYRLHADRVRWANEPSKPPDVG